MQGFDHLPTTLRMAGWLGRCTSCKVLDTATNGTEHARMPGRSPKDSSGNGAQRYPVAAALDNLTERDERLLICTLATDPMRGAIPGIPAVSLRRTGTLSRKF
jgi:hypothetical protein